MPEIIPMLPEGTLTQTQSTQMPSRQMKTMLTAQPEQTLAPEPKNPESSAEPKEPSLEQKRLKALLFKERQFQNQRRKIEEERKIFEEEKKQYQTWIEAGRLAQQDKLAALAKTGITYEELTQQILNNGQIPPAQVAELKAQEISQKAIEQFRREQQEAQASMQKQQYEQTMKQVAQEARYIVEKSIDKYPLVKESEAYDDIAKIIESDFHRTGQITPIEEAIERWEGEALDGLAELAKLEKVRNKVFVDDRPSPNPQISIPRTLSQRAMAPIPSPKPMTDAERRQRAIDVFYGRAT